MNVIDEERDSFAFTVSYFLSIVIFAVCWLYCVFSYGFLLGVGLGWLPSYIVACISRHALYFVAELLFDAHRAIAHFIDFTLTGIDNLLPPQSIITVVCIVLGALVICALFD